MQALKKWLFIFAAVVFVGSMFADKILSFYVDWLWFENHGIASVLWTVLVYNLVWDSSLGFYFSWQPMVF